MTDSSSADVSQPVEPGKPFTPQRRHLMWAAAVVVGLFLLLLGHNLFVDVPLIISKKTTYITEPLTPDGTRVDYLRDGTVEISPEMQKPTITATA
ncbi:MAG: hypothetical protein R3C01_01010 [Planctomycetaceae bacterium]